MPVFTPNLPIQTDTPVVEVTVNADNLLSVGVHTFQLVVTDDAGNASAPALVEIVVRDMVAPTAVIDGPRLVGFNQSFELSGARSSDPPPGRIALYTWTLIDDPGRPTILEPVRPVLIDTVIAPRITP